MGQQQQGQQQQQQQQGQQQQQQGQQQFHQHNQHQQNELNLQPDQTLQVPGPSGEVTYRNVAQRMEEMHEVESYDDGLYEDLDNEEMQDVQREFYASTTNTISNEEVTEPVQGASFDQGGTNTKKDKGKALRLRVSESKTLPTAKKSAPPTKETQQKSRTQQRKRKSRGENEEEEVQSDDSETSNMSRNSHTSAASSKARRNTMAQKKQDEKDQQEMDVAGNPDRCYPYLNPI